MPSGVCDDHGESGAARTLGDGEVFDEFRPVGGCLSHHERYRIPVGA